MPGSEEHNVSQLLDSPELVEDLPLQDLHQQLPEDLLPDVSRHAPILPHLEQSTRPRGA